MSEVTEIYICKAGQKIKDGRIEYSDSIRDKEAAAENALFKCKIDPSIHKIVYYAVSPSGAFKSIYSYTNPNCTDAPGAEPTVAKKKKKKKKPKTLWQKITGSLSGK